jgi:hypothetical protein
MALFGLHVAPLVIRVIEGEKKGESSMWWQTP